MKSILHRIFLGFLLILIVGCASSQPQQNTEINPKLTCEKNLEKTVHAVSEDEIASEVSKTQCEEPVQEKQSSNILSYIVAFTVSFIVSFTLTTILLN